MPSVKTVFVTAMLSFYFAHWQVQCQQLSQAESLSARLVKRDPFWGSKGNRGSWHYGESSGSAASTSREGGGNEPSQEGSPPPTSPPQPREVEVEQSHSSEEEEEEWRQEADYVEPSSPSDSDLEQHLWYDKHFYPPVFPVHPQSFTKEGFQRYQEERRAAMQQAHEDKKERKAFAKRLQRYKERKTRKMERKRAENQEEERTRYPNEEYLKRFYRTIRRAKRYGRERGAYLEETLRIMIEVPEMTQYVENREPQTPQEHAQYNHRLDQDARRFLQQHADWIQPMLGQNLTGWVATIQNRYEEQVNNLNLLDMRREEEIEANGAPHPQTQSLMLLHAREAVRQLRILQYHFHAQYEMAKRIARGEHINDDE